MSPPRPPPKSIEAGTEIGTLVVVVDRAVSLLCFLLLCTAFC